jgi:glutaredoxin 2
LWFSLAGLSADNTYKRWLEWLAAQVKRRRLIRKWRKTSHGFKEYYIYDRYYGISVHHFRTKKQAEEAYRDGVARKKDYLQKFKQSWIDWKVTS